MGNCPRRLDAEHRCCGRDERQNGQSESHVALCATYLRRATGPVQHGFFKPRALLLGRAFLRLRIWIDRMGSLQRGQSLRAPPRVRPTV